MQLLKTIEMETQGLRVQVTFQNETASLPRPPRNEFPSKAAAHKASQRKLKTQIPVLLVCLSTSDFPDGVEAVL